VGFTGFDGGLLLPMADVPIHVPIQDMCKAEGVHSILMHLLRDLLYRNLRASAATRARA
jgi:hypothetical protein